MTLYGPTLSASSPRVIPVSVQLSDPMDSSKRIVPLFLSLYLQHQSSSLLKRAPVLVFPLTKPHPLMAPEQIR